MSLHHVMTVNVQSLTKVPGQQSWKNDPVESPWCVSGVEDK